MPIEVAVYYPNQNKPQVETVQVIAKSNVFVIKVSEEQKEIILDSNMWVLMDADFKKAA